MTDKIQAISDQRRAALIGIGSGFLILQIVVFQSDTALTWIPYILNAALVGLAYVGLSIVFQKGRYQSNDIENALEDELVNSNRNTAGRYGFYAVIIFAALLNLITPFWGMSGHVVARTLLTVGVVTPMFVFAYIDRADA